MSLVRLAGVRRASVWLPMTALVFLAAAPLLFSGYTLAFLVNVLLHITLAASWNLFSGFTGWFSLGHGVFFGIGAHAFAVVLRAPGLGALAAVWAAAAASGAVAAFLALTVLRVRMGIAQFAVLLLGLNEIVKILVTNADALGASYGMTLPLTPAPQHVFYGLLATAATAVAISAAMATPPYGLAYKAPRADPVVAEAMGVPVLRFKSISMVLSGIFPGLAGALTAWYWSYIDPHIAFDLSISFQMVIMAVFGGAGTVWGPVVGAVVFSILQEAFGAAFPYFHNVILGGLVVLVVLATRGGISEWLRRRSPSRIEAVPVAHRMKREGVEG